MPTSGAGVINCSPAVPDISHHSMGWMTKTGHGTIRVTIGNTFHGSLQVCFQMALAPAAIAWPLATHMARCCRCFVLEASPGCTVPAGPCIQCRKETSQVQRIAPNHHGRICSVFAVVLATERLQRARVVRGPRGQGQDAREAAAVAARLEAGLSAADGADDFEDLLHRAPDHVIEYLATRGTRQLGTFYTEASTPDTP